MDAQRSEAVMNNNTATVATTDRAIVKATIDMAHAVGLTVVAEGVETREQEDYLQQFGCDRAQGYLYSRAQPAQAITDMLAAAAR